MICGINQHFTGGGSLNPPPPCNNVCCRTHNRVNGNVGRKCQCVVSRIMSLTVKCPPFHAELQHFFAAWTPWPPCPRIFEQKASAQLVQFSEKARIGKNGKNEPIWGLFKNIIWKSLIMTKKDQIFS